VNVSYIQATYCEGEMCGAYIHLPRLKKKKLQMIRSAIRSNCPANMNEYGVVVKRISVGTTGF
jgi:hypothetical protein